jgi:hypothetical protein
MLARLPCKWQNAAGSGAARSICDGTPLVADETEQAALVRIATGRRTQCRAGQTLREIAGEHPRRLMSSIMEQGSLIRRPSAAHISRRQAGRPVAPFPRSVQRPPLSSF